MRTNIDIDDKLMASAMKIGGFTTKREAVHEALRQFEQRKRVYKKLLDLGGTWGAQEGAAPFLALKLPATPKRRSVRAAA